MNEAAVCKLSLYFDNPQNKRRTNFIYNRRIESRHLDYLTVTSPINGQSLYEIPISQTSEIDAAVNFAEKAFKKWSYCTSTIRSSILNSIAKIIEDNLELLAYAESHDTGKILQQSIGEIRLAAKYFKYFASAILLQEGTSAQVEDMLSLNLHEPLGKICIILPWNCPLLMFSWKVAPAIGTGNTVIIKPSENACLSILILMEKLQNIIPPGVINIILGDGKTTGSALLSNGNFQKIFFTGSVETGKAVMTTAGHHIIPVSLELGGKSPCIVSSDIFNHDNAYIEQLIDAVSEFTYNQGQICGKLSRLLLHRSIADKVLLRLSNRLKNYSVGNPLLSQNNMGPMISSRQLKCIQDDIILANNEGAKIYTFNTTLNIANDCKNGYYMPPVLIEGSNNMTVFQKEIFGPVLCYTVFDDLDEAISIANQNDYGLTAAIWSQKITEVNYLLKRISAGKIWVNTSNIYYPHTKFGGRKKSGFGNEMHHTALSEYQVIKNVIQKY